MLVRCHCLQGMNVQLATEHVVGQRRVDVSLRLGSVMETMTAETVRTKTANDVASIMQKKLFALGIRSCINKSAFCVAIQLGSIYTDANYSRECSCSSFRLYVQADENENTRSKHSHE